MGYGQVHLGEVDVHAKFGQLRLSSLGIRGWFVFSGKVLGGFIYTRLYEDGKNIIYRYIQGVRTSLEH